MTTETPEPRFERFCLAYSSGTAVMAFYGDDGEVRVTHTLAVVEVVEDSRVSFGIPEVRWAGYERRTRGVRRGCIGNDAEV